MKLRECPFCGQAFWRENKSTPLSYFLEHNKDCFLSPTTLLVPDSPKFLAWNERVSSDKLIQELNEMICRLRRSVSPVTDNPKEDAFYERAEAEL